jgi:hypothetical protein
MNTSQDQTAPPKRGFESRPHGAHSSTGSGFTLIELLVVIAMKDPNGFSPAPRSGAQRNRDLQWVSDRYIFPPRP